MIAQNKPIYNVVSFSGGKDSTAMLLKMIELNMQIDCILFCDTGLEFPDMYKHIDEVEKRIGRPITRIKTDKTFEELMFEVPVKRKNIESFVEQFGRNYTGYGWPGPRMRWCTTRLKDVPRERFLKNLREKYTVIEYIGIAADEGYRLERKRNINENHRHPLVDLNMTEADCLKLCYELGYTWNGLYNHFKRVSCWCCPLQSLAELRKLRKHYPDLWEKLKYWETLTWRKFREDYSISELDIRFDLEEKFIKQGLPVNNKYFFTKLKEQLKEAYDVKIK